MWIRTIGIINICFSLALLTGPGCRGGVKPVTAEPQSMRTDVFTEVKGPTTPSGRYCRFTDKSLHHDAHYRALPP